MVIYMLLPPGRSLITHFTMTVLIVKLNKIRICSRQKILTENEFDAFNCQSKVFLPPNKFNGVGRFCRSPSRSVPQLSCFNRHGSKSDLSEKQFALAMPPSHVRDVSLASQSPFLTVFDLLPLPIVVLFFIGSSIVIVSGFPLSFFSA